MNEADLKREIAAGGSGGYLFFGDEDYLKSYYAASLRRAVCGGSEGSFGASHMEGASFDADALERMITSSSLFGGRNFIEVTDLPIASMKEKDLERLEEILKWIPHYDHVVLFHFSAGALDVGYLPKRPSAAYKLLSSCLKTVQFDKPTPARLRTWVEKHAVHEGLLCDPDAADYIIEACGKSMMTIRSELEKLCAYVHAHQRPRITFEDARLVVAPVWNEEDFALSNALLERNREKFFDAVGIMKQQKTEPLGVLSMIAKVYLDLLHVKTYAEAGISAAQKMNMHPYKAELYQKAAVQLGSVHLHRAVEMCREADIAMKSGADGWSTVEGLLAELLGN